MRAALVLMCALILIGILVGVGTSRDAAPQTRTAIEFTRTTEVSQPEETKLIEVTDEKLLEVTPSQIALGNKACTKLNKLWLLEPSAGTPIKMLKAQCAEGDYQMTLFDGKAYIKSWTGILMGP